MKLRGWQDQGKPLSCEDDFTASRPQMGSMPLGSEEPLTPKVPGCLTPYSQNVPIA